MCFSANLRCDSLCSGLYITGSTRVCRRRSIAGYVPPNSGDTGGAHCGLYVFSSECAEALHRTSMDLKECHRARRDG